MVGMYQEGIKNENKGFFGALGSVFIRDWYFLIGHKNDKAVFMISQKILSMGSAQNSDHIGR